VRSLQLVPLVLAACGSPPIAPPQFEVSVTELGPLRFVDSIRARDGGYSAGWHGRSVWTFGDTVLETAAEDGERWRSSTWCFTRDLDAADGLADLSEPLDARGAPGEFVPFTPEEAAFNAEHNREELGDERRRYALWPGPVAVAPDGTSALVFYWKLTAGVGAWNFASLGGSLARWNATGERPVRDEVRPGTSEPTLLFPEGDANVGQGALVAGEHLYAYGVTTRGLSWPCILARVRYADALDRDAWRFWAGAKGWVPDFREARAIMQSAPQMSVHWNAHLGRYLAIYGEPLGNALLLRTAPAPEGPWSEPLRFHEGLAPVGDDAWNYCGLGHAELQQEDGCIEYVTYFRTTGFLQGEIRLLRLEIASEPPAGTK